MQDGIKSGPICKICVLNGVMKRTLPLLLTPEGSMHIRQGTQKLPAHRYTYNHICVLISSEQFGQDWT
jgi:hypothetical protein